MIRVTIQHGICTRHYIFPTNDTYEDVVRRIWRRIDLYFSVPDDHDVRALVGDGLTQPFTPYSNNWVHRGPDVRISVYIAPRPSLDTFHSQVLHRN